MTRQTERFLKEVREQYGHCKHPETETCGQPHQRNPPAVLREVVTALFGSAVLEYLMEYKTSNTDFVHTIAYGKMMAYRQLAVVLGDDGLTAQFDDEISWVLDARGKNK